MDILNPNWCWMSEMLDLTGCLLTTTQQPLLKYRSSVLWYSLCFRNTTPPWRGSQVVDTILNKSFTWELVKIPAANCRIQKSRRKTTLFILLITFGFYYNASEMLAG